jgi:hypothetical protein
MVRRRTRQVPTEFEEDWKLLRDLKRGHKSYVGTRDKNDNAVVRVTDGQTRRALPICRNIVSHSHGFEWGYAGSGPAQLALAILADFLEDPEKALRYHQKFKSMVILGLPKQGWELQESVVREAVNQIEAEENSRVTDNRPSGL